MVYSDAAGSGWLNGVQKLLELRADPFVKNGKGSTLVDMCALTSNDINDVFAGIGVRPEEPTGGEGRRPSNNNINKNKKKKDYRI